MQGDVTDLDLQLHGVPACLRVGVPGMPPVIDREVRPSSRPRTAARVDIAPSSPVCAQRVDALGTRDPLFRGAF